MNRSKTWITTAAWIAAVAAGVAGGYWWAGREGSADMTNAEPEAAADEREVLYWYDPMVPGQRFDKPGKSPFMDMQLVPKYADEATGAAVDIDPGLRQNVGIRTETVAIGRLATTLRVPGTLAWDLNRESVVSAVAASLVSRVEVKAPYTRVERGQPLATLLAPAWSTALAEAHALRQAESAAARELQAAAQQRLRVLGVPAGASGDGSVTVAAPHAGVVSEVLVRDGQAVMAGTPLFRINGTATVWLQAAVPQAEASRLRAGTPVRARVDGLPERRFDGEVETLLPQVDPATRTQQARIVLRNPDGVLAPGMFAEVAIRPEAGPARPLVPTGALIATGADSRVIVQDADGRFHPLRVRVGRSGDGRSEILEGLKGGERVVVSGQFLIDSEASLSGLLERLDGARDDEAGNMPDESVPDESVPDEGMPDMRMPGESEPDDGMPDESVPGEGMPAGDASAADTPALHQADASVRAIAEGRIELSHGPFPTLHMPGMTMRFPLADPALAEGLRVGDSVRVWVRSDADGLTVERLEPLADSATGQQETQP
ncbi:efflux RND transporter periplasmic adaptor subunit [Marilutibacter maris]|uniref:Co/Zn/Cd efflux system membrane fusion protein n=1 Tax=Marilutibacter maris TaxID=1605891 RepID=A0A2U9T171_9GAMM|nr:efflux RND transporter periplasmic adaptor subunit [Lysobacter maris]AWV06183.1 Putative Co/Zn/Cd efflux system membrane fusion protein [Lysobacter maris]